MSKDKNAPGKKRLFLGTFLSQSDKEALGELHSLDERLSEAWSRKLRWVAAEKLHLTWLFLGLVEETCIVEVKSIVDSILAEQQALELSYDEPVLWPGQEHARHFVLIPEAVPDFVFDLAGKFSKGLLPYTERPESSHYRPHLTLLNMDPAPGQLSIPDWLGLDRKLPLRHHINQIDLIESHLGSSRQYESLFNWRLPG